MWRRNQEEILILKKSLLEKLKEEQAFWSYNRKSVTVENVSDDDLIALTMRHLDLPEISQLFKLYSFRKIKTAWKKLLVPEGDYLYTLNRFFAWYYFGVKNPDSYLKNIQTRQINSLLNS